MKCCVRPVQHGRGVFATEAITKGERILVFSGPLLVRAELRTDEYHLQVGPDLYFGPSGLADDYLNHSCEPNSGFDGGYGLVALRDIQLGEEITWDYSTAIDEADFAGMACWCRRPSCRGVVKSFRHLDSATQNRLKPWLLPYLRAAYVDKSENSTAQSVAA